MKTDVPIPFRPENMRRTLHDLKSPFSVIKVNLHLLLKGHCGELSDKAQKAIERIDTKCRQGLALLADVSQMAYLQPEEKTSLNVPEILKDCIERIQPAACARNIKIETDLQPVTAQVAQEHLKLIFDQILANAIHYSNESGRVLVRCGPNSDGPQVVIRDEGIGIPADQKPRIFEEYFRTMEAARHHKEGTGLGLAIVRQAATMANVRVELSSQTGEGTTVKLTLPPA